MNKKYEIAKDFRWVCKLKNFNNNLSMNIANKVLSLDYLLTRPDKNTDVKKITIKTKDNPALDLIIFKPKKIKEKANCLVYFAGGAYMMVPTSVHKKNIIYYTKEANCVCILVLYRLAPKHPFPSAHLDAYEALEYVFKNAEKLGVNPNKIVVGGDSAGGNLAASVCLLDRDNGYDRIKGQMLVYPALDYGSEIKSRQIYTDTPMFNSKAEKFMLKTYYKHGFPKIWEGYAFPCKNENLKNLPPAYIETAEFDCLRDDGIKYAHLLKDNGVNSTLFETTGTMHGYDAARSSPITKEGLKSRAEFLNSIFYRKD